MKIIIAPDKFKGSLTAKEFCQASQDGLLKAGSEFEILQFPLADGGDGLLEVLEYYGDYERVYCKALDPLFRETETFYLYDPENRIAFIEMALISGLNLLQANERNCMHSTSYGFGQLIRHAVDLGAENIYLGIGGSATNDGGIGMASALGYNFCDVNGSSVKAIGSELIKIDKIHIPKDSKALRQVKFTILSDVQNYWTGTQGAVEMFAKQKGASKVERTILEEGMVNLAEKIQSFIGISVFDLAGAGAAGGVGGASQALLQGELISGADFVIDLSGIEGSLMGADLLITGEGSLDEQSAYGKVISSISSLALKRDVECIAIVGKNSASLEFSSVFSAIYTLEKIAKNKEDSMKNAITYVKKITYELGQSLI